VLDARKLGSAHLGILIEGLRLGRPAALGVDDHGARWWRHGALRLEIAFNVDAQRTLILAGVTKSERAFIGFERPNRLDPRDSELLDGLRHGSKYSIVALLDQPAEYLLVFCL
jgi:hypothetical protein